MTSTAYRYDTGLILIRWFRRAGRDMELRIECYRLGAREKEVFSENCSREGDYVNRRS